MTPTRHTSPARARRLALVLGLALAAAAASPPAAAAEARVVIPATSAGIWQAIDGQVAQLKEALRSGKLDTVHAHAFAIRDLAAALPPKAGALPAETVAQVKADERFVATLAERLDATGDANDKAGTQANLGKLERVLKSLRGRVGGDGGTHR